MKNILVFSSFPTFPLRQGSSIRTWNLLNNIKSNNYRIHIVYYGAYKNNTNNLKLLNDYFDSVTILNKETESTNFKGRNIPLDSLYEDGLGEKISELSEYLEVDIVICNYIFYSKILEYLPKKIYKIIDTHDVFTDKYKIEDWFSFSKNEEAKGLNRADLVIAIQDNEKKYFESISNSKVVTINHLEENKFIDREYPTLKNIGILSSGHKQDLIAIKEFLKHFKTFSKKYPQVNLFLAGNICNKLSKNEYNQKNIHLLYLVKDLKDFYTSIDIVCSIPLNGTGLKIKTVETLAYGVPLIATSCAIEGIDSSIVEHNCKDVNTVFSALEKVLCKNDYLNFLHKESKKIFDSYITKNKKAVDDVFPMEERFEDKTYDKLIKLYNKHQYILAKKNINPIRQEEKKLFDSINRLANIKFSKKPFMKYKAYKNMLKNFNKLN